MKLQYSESQKNIGNLLPLEAGVFKSFPHHCYEATVASLASLSTQPEIKFRSLLSKSIYSSYVGYGPTT